MTNIHAHVATASADCDGPIYREYVEQFNADELAEQANANGINDFSDMHFMDRVFIKHCSPYAAHQLSIKVDESGMEWHEQTEEGFRAGGLRWCHDECEDVSSYRDIYAEQMGY